MLVGAVRTGFLWKVRLELGLSERERRTRAVGEPLGEQEFGPDGRERASS